VYVVVVVVMMMMMMMMMSDTVPSSSHFAFTHSCVMSLTVSHPLTFQQSMTMKLQDK
jgi:hypothetical protein